MLVVKKTQIFALFCAFLGCLFTDIFFSSLVLLQKGEGKGDIRGDGRGWQFSEGQVCTG